MRGAAREGQDCLSCGRVLPRGEDSPRCTQSDAELMAPAVNTDSEPIAGDT